MNDEKKQQEEMLALLARVVNIDSGSYDKQGVDALAEVWQSLYCCLGFEVEVFHNENFGNNYRITHKDAVNPQILILLHLDTVFPKGSVQTLHFKIIGERAYGAGVIDMKASHVQVYYALKQLIEENHPAYKNIQILLNSDEEIGSKSSRTLIESSAQNKSYALVMEPARANGAIVSSRRGVGNYELRIKGIASHAGIAPELGVSAIQELSFKIQALHALSAHDQGASVNVGIVSGGSSVNTIADYAVAEIDLRFSSAQQGEVLDAQIKKICQKPVLDGIALSLSGGLNRPTMEKTETSQKVIDLIKSEAEKLNINIEDIHTGGGSDASFTAGVGLASVDGLGPVGGLQHSDKEYLEIDSLFERTALFVNILKKLS